MLTTYNLKMPHAVYGGENAMDNITAILKLNGVKRVAMFTDKGIEAAGLFSLPEEAVKAAGADYYVLDELPAEPSYMAVQKLVDEFKASGADMIVACGGGSVMDAAKLASILVTDEYGVKELLDDPGRAKKCVPIILIPTTAGTGAEVTPNAIVAVPEKELKVGIVNENMIADYVILDARMIKNLPRKIAAATGVDALAHCIECFTSNKANPFSDLYALEGLDLILNNIEKACDDPEAMTEKNRMQIAAYYGGLAITASGTTAVHALSYPLGGKYHIAHGVSNAILLAPVMRFNEPACRERFAIAYEDTSVELPAGQSFDLNGKDAVLDAVSLSPVALVIDYTVDGEVEMEEQGDGRLSDRNARELDGFRPQASITLDDGTVIDASNSGTHLETKDGKTVARASVILDRILDLDEVAFVTVEGVRIPVG